MDRLRDNNATPKKDTGSKGVDNDNQFRNDTKNREVEIEQPNPSTATPAVPEEMPAREMR